MAREFVGVDRSQLLLMPPALQEWLPEDHLVWTVLGAVEQMDLSRFNDAYRLGAAGRPNSACAGAGMEVGTELRSDQQAVSAIQGDMQQEVQHAGQEIFEDELSGGDVLGELSARTLTPASEMMVMAEPASGSVRGYTSGCKMPQ
jgi:hypothetical protein